MQIDSCSLFFCYNVAETQIKRWMAKKIENYQINRTVPFSIWTIFYLLILLHFKSAGIYKKYIEPGLFIYFLICSFNFSIN